MEHIKEISKKDIEKLKKEKLREDSEKKRQEEENRRKQLDAHKEASNKKRKKMIIISAGIIGLLVFAIAAYSVINNMTPGRFDNFARCLTEKGAVMYGALSWCKYTQEQVGMFGKSFKYINYKDFPELPGILYTPTWVIDGKWHEKVQSFETLSALTGCDWSQ